MKPILSIVIPTYNRCNYLKECLDSIAECSIDSQKKIEVIICNNFSQDKTELAINNFIQSNTHINKINVISSKELIPAQNNWENGINNSKASRILLLSDDDKVIYKGLDKIIKEELFLKYKIDKTKIQQHNQYLLHKLKKEIFKLASLKKLSLDKFEKGNIIADYFSGTILLNESKYDKSYRYLKKLEGLENSHFPYTSKYLYSLINSANFRSLSILPNQCNLFVI